MGPRTIAVLLIGFLCQYAYASQKPISIDLNRPDVAPLAGESKTRLLKVDYSFETESVLYDVLENKVAAPSTVMAGNFSFETMHFDTEGSVLARFTLTQCRSGPCGEVEPIYVAFVQGGNNLEGVFAQGDSDPEWNFLYAIVNTIYTPAEGGAGDEQNVQTVYGQCRVQFGRPEDKKFRRKINSCDLISRDGFNFTKIDGLQVAGYSQDVLYTQNAKVDADIAIIDAIEILSMTTPFDKRWGFQLESRTHVEIKNRTRLYVPRYCSSDVTAKDCALQAFQARPVGGRLYERVHVGKKAEENKLGDSLTAYREHLHSMGDSHTCEKHSKMFSEVVERARRASEEEWTHAIKAPENEPVLPMMGNVLGALGSVSALKIAREHLFVEGAEFVDDYLFGAAHATTYDEKWHKQMMYWLGESRPSNEQLFWKIANTLATILRRRCERSTSSMNACNKDKEKIVSKFISDVSNCDSEFCHQKALETLLNLPIAGSYQLAKKFLCGHHSPPVQMAALRLIREAHHHLYDSQLVGLLIKLFRNTCPHQTSTGESQLAIDVLIKCIPDHQNAATLLLRTESVQPQDQEKWQYFYKAIEASNNKDELKQAFWSRMRQFKVFRPNYAHRALLADSNAHWQELTDVSGYRLQQQSSAEFDSGLFKRSELEISVKKGKKTHSLFGLSVTSAGLDSFVKDGSAVSVATEPEASVRLSFFGHALPTTTIFKGNSDMMSVVWNADGQTIKAFEGGVLLREASSSFPLLSGLSVSFSSAAAAAVRLFGSCELSLWNRDSITHVDANVSVSLSSSVSLHLHGVQQHSLSSSLSLVTSIGSSIEAMFQELPFHFCLTMDRKPVTVTLTTSSTNGADAKESQRVRHHTNAPITIRLDDSTTKQCNLHAKQHLTRI